MRKALERQVAAQEESELLLQAELSHQERFGDRFLVYCITGQGPQGSDGSRSWKAQLRGCLFWHKVTITCGL
jgi:hypothetical protein